MKKKGFTLIELLAVIVILAIIALIATPLVLKYIEYSKEKSAKLSANTYAEAVEKEYVSKLTHNEKMPNKEYTIKELDELGVKVKGDKPEGNTDYVVLNNGNVTEYELTINDYVIKYENGNVDIGSNNSNHNNAIDGYTATFMSDGKIYSIVSVLEGNAITEPVSPVSDQGMFSGWQINGENITFPYKLEGNVNIEAYFQTVHKEIEVYNAGDRIAYNSSYNYDKKNDGWAIAGRYYNSSGWYGLFLVGKTADSVPFLAAGTNSFSYNGETYYYARQAYSGTLNSGVVTPYNVGTHSSDSAAATALLDYYFYVN